MKKVLAFLLSLSLIFSFSVTAFAASPMTFDEAKAYLQNYCVTKENSFGKEYTTEYVFNSEEDLNKAAAYIAENGLNAFNESLEVAIATSVANEPKQTLDKPRITEPLIVYRTVSSDGVHDIIGLADGLASFDTLGTVEYQVDLGYRVTVSNGKFTDLEDISVDIHNVSAGGSWGDISLPSHCFDYNCGVTANYVITKSVEIPIGDFSFEIKAETDKESFAVLTRITGT